MEAVKGALKNLTWGYRNMPNLAGKVFIVTGGNSGLGYAACKHLAEHEAHVIMATRNEDRAQSAIQDIQKEIREGRGRLDFMPLDLSSLKSVEEFAGAFRARGLPLHCLINNAGVMLAEGPTMTEDGFEVTIGTNVFGHLLLTHLLLDLLRESAPSRVVFMSSPEEARASGIPWDDLTGASREKKGDMDSYGIANLMKLMLGMELARRLKGSGIDVFVVHPGMTSTDLFRKMDFERPESTTHDVMQKMGGQSIESGALSTLYAATEPRLQGNPGGFYGSWYYRLPTWFSMRFPMGTNLFNKMRVNPASSVAKDPGARARLWDEACGTLERVMGRALPNRVVAAGAAGIST